MIVQILFSLFILFAFSRVVLRYRENSIGFFAFIFWSILWVVISIFLWYPDISSILANWVGIGRGVDVLIYVSIVIIFYFLFRLYVRHEEANRNITNIVRHQALHDAEGDYIKKDKV